VSEESFSLFIRDYAAASAAAGPKWFFRPLYPMKIPKDFFFLKPNPLFAGMVAQIPLKKHFFSSQ
jgi:hypothetical protein